MTWTNSGSAPHSATGTGGTFDTGILDPAGSATITFNTPGTYSYFCSVHPDMTGTITVVAGDDGGGDGGNGDGGSDDDGGDDGGGDDGGDDPVTQLPDTGFGPDASSSTGALLALLALAVALAAGSVAVRSRAR